MALFSRLLNRSEPVEQPVEERNISIANPAVIELFTAGTPNLTGVNVSEQTALGLSAVWRAVCLISGTIASLPMRTVTTGDRSERVKSFLDTPGGPNGMTPYSWVETVMTHLLLHGNAYLAHIYGGAGQLIGLQPIHPCAVSVECLNDGTKFYRVTLNDGKQEVFDMRSMTHIPALSTDGIEGLSPLHVARNSLGTSIAGDRSAARLFGNGALPSAIVTPVDDLTEEEATAIKNSLDRKMSGEANAGAISVINRKLDFKQWSINPVDAQFLESRAFQIEEIARWYGVPPHQLMQTDKQTSWGSGVSEQNRGLARYTLMPWTTRVEQSLSRLLSGNKKVEFDYHSLLKPAPEQEIPLLIQQVQAGLLTINEARSILNLAPIENGDIPTSAETEDISA